MDIFSCLSTKLFLLIQLYSIFKTNEAITKFFFYNVFISIFGKLKTKKFNNLESRQKAANYHIPGTLSKMIRFFIRNFRVQNTVSQYTQSAKRKNFQPRILYPEKLFLRMNKKLRHSQINKSWGSSSPFDLPWNKCSRESFKVKRQNTRW